jgi:hypothetical protein
MLLRPTLLVLIGASVHAADLPGIPVPGRIDTPDIVVEGGDSDIGPEGGGSGDDWRVAHGNVDWDHDWISAAVDYSILTFKNLNGAPTSSGAQASSTMATPGSGRSDEITASIAFRASYGSQTWRSWAQAGPGIQLSGDLGGRSIQNEFHAVIGNPPSNLSYEHPGLRAVGLVHAGAGGRVQIAGPFAIDARAMDMETTGGWNRWRAEAMVLAAGRGGGVWAGMRQDGASGHALTSVADQVAQHETGLDLVVGMSWHIHDVQLSVETSHNFDNGGQDGYVSLAYTPQQDVPTLLVDTEPQRWHVRLGLSGEDTRVPGYGTDIELGTSVDGLPKWLQWVIGIREQDMGLPFVYAFSGQRVMTWTGLEAETIVVGSPSANLFVAAEGGAGVRNDKVVSHGAVTVDGNDSARFTTPIVRAAAGIGGRIAVGEAHYGLLLLTEATAAVKRDVVLKVHDVVHPTTLSDGDVIHLDGGSVGFIYAFTIDWQW